MEELRANHSRFIYTSRSGDKSAGQGRPALPFLIILVSFTPRVQATSGRGRAAQPYRFLIILVSFTPRARATSRRGFVKTTPGKQGQGRPALPFF
jgi:hypothetical protein